MSWADQLVRASFRGFEFDVISTTDAIERRVTEHEYLYRDGADLDDLGRKARPCKLTAVFHGAGYLTDLVAFMRLCDEGATGPLRHPLLGTWQAKAVSVQVQQEASARDHAKVEVEFKEDGTNTTLEGQSVEAAQDGLTTASAAVTTVNEQLDEPLDSVGAAVTDAGAYVTDVEDTGDDLQARYDQLERSVRTAQDDLRDVDAVTAWPVDQALRDMLLAAKELRERIERLYPQAIDQELAADMPLVSLALRLYGDAARADDLLRLNKVRQPFLVPAGTVLRVHSA